ncbi:undecaprenyl-phosphate 4-deoxy-4-formamido-L-arabinose transferase [Singulisphaera sp. GP187]|uniref:glycosyltransferase n=1 Tax=Singulisphaera sp. GP187 TaxID=1882752 RepID=UPI000929B96A|nr:glycosyltransferase family 2 protein [Singulisphaera sp. GP187]SIO42898.1 undecaprenyl-phosphate 4-deoxy-4-formamido-L-arabinose transferase [Singulisphaera sp. GP187]
MRASEETPGSRELELELSIVIPAFRSEGCLQALANAIDATLGPLGWRYEVILVNDGSPDGTWAVIESLCQTRENYVGIDLRRNFGQDNAILTGLRAARGSLIAIMDDDLQHDPGDLPLLRERLLDERADAIYAHFGTKHQQAWKNLGSWFNGKFAEWVIEKPKGIYLSPYKLIRKEIAEAICEYQGPDPYVDGLLFQVTARIGQVHVAHHPRYADHGNYTFFKSLKVWARLATAFSVKPIRLVLFGGCFFAALGGALALYVVAYRLLYPEDFERGVAGWASLMVAQLLTTAIRMIFLGIVGEYAGRTYIAVCHKPQATVREVLYSSPGPVATPPGRAESHGPGTKVEP